MMFEPRIDNTLGQPKWNVIIQLYICGFQFELLQCVNYAIHDKILIQPLFDTTNNNKDKSVDYNMHSYSITL